MNQRDTGFVALHMVESDTEYRLPPEEYDRVLAEWMAGRAFIATVQYFGAPLTVKAARIECISLMRPDALAAYEAHLSEERARRALQGE